MAGLGIDCLVSLWGGHRVEGPSLWSSRILETPERDRERPQELRSGCPEGPRLWGSLARVFKSQALRAPSPILVVL